MELLEKFKQHLLSQKNASKITVKNYLADIRKFIRWFETRYQTTFTASAINTSVANEYTKQISTNAPRSVKRYTSSLKKFCTYLKAEGVIQSNPFEINTEEKKNEVDPWLLQEFKNSLYNAKASRLTIKNYMIDIQQFLNWLYQITTAVEVVNNRASILGKINTELVEIYKNRLLEEANLSPVSVNRKLSSLRKYIGWITEKGLLKEQTIITTAATPQIALEQTKDKTDVQRAEPLTLESLEKLTKPTEEKKEVPASYSRIPFIRFGQKVGKGISLLFDLIIILPFSKAIAASKYNLWKASGKEVFTPLQDVVKAYGETIPAQIKTISPIETVSTTTKATANSLSILDKLLGLKGKTTLGRIRNLPKSLYAPLAISTTHLPWSKKIMHFLRHRRPQWYKKYHSYSFVHYLHFAILLIFVTTTGFGFYRAFFDTPRSQKPALAALPTTPPRVLSFQGRLTDSSNTPLTADTPLRFGIYSNQTASGSALLWQEVQTVAPDEDGIFSVLLGSKNPISQGLFANNASLYLGITVNNDSELTPRQQLATVAYAANAETLQGLLPITKPNAGTANVVLALDSSGNLTMGGNANPTFQATGGQFSLIGQTLFLGSTPGSNGNVIISPDGSGIIALQKPLQNTSNYNNIASARGAVEVDDLFAILATSSGQSALTINQNSTGPIISASSGGTAKFTVSNSGAGTFASDLAVNGNNITTTSNSFNLLNTNAITLNIGGAATSLSIGASSGTTEINNALEVNGNTTFGGITYSWPSSQSNGAVLQTNGSGGLSWVSLGSITNGWQINEGAIAPSNTTNDFLIGGSASSSAKFQVSSSTGSITTAGNLTFTSGASIQTTGSQTLTIGGTTTGNIILAPTNSTGTITFAGYGTGILHSNSSGLLTSSAINIASSDVTGTLPIANGGTNTTSLGSAGSIAYSNGSAYGFTGVGSAGQCLQSNGAGVPVWGSCDSASTYWQESNGTLSPTNSTTDFLVGGTATASAKFGFLNVNSGTPTASISAGTSGASYFTATGTLGTTAGQSLTLGTNTTGNVMINPGGTTALTAITNGNVGIGTLTPESKLHVGGASIGKALIVLNETGDQNILTASASGTTVANLDGSGNFSIAGQLSNLNGNTLTINDTLNIVSGSTYQINGTSVISANALGTGITSSSLTSVGTLAGGVWNATAIGTQYGGTGQNFSGVAQGALPYFSATGTMNTLGVGTAGQCLMTNGVGANPSWGNCSNATNYWQITNGALFPENNTLDFFVGGTASASAKFAVLNVSSGTPTASLSAGAGGTYLAANGSLQTTNNQGLTIGGNTTGDITLSPQNGSGTVNSLGNVNLAAGKTFLINGTEVLSGNTLGAGIVNSSLTSVGTLASGNIASGFGTIATANTITGTTINGTTGINSGAGAGTQRIDASGNLVNIGTITASGLVSANAGLTVATGQNLTLSSFTTNNNSVLYTGAAGLVNAATTSTSGLCLMSNANTPAWATCPSGSAASGWQINNGATSPINNTLDVLVGNTASNSAKFGFLNVNTGTPTASISANSGANSTFLTGTGTLGTTNAQSLTLGSTSTGNIILTPGGTAALTAFKTGQIGIGATNPLATLDVRGNSGTTPVASISGQTAQAAFIIDNSGNGDLFSASKSGLTRFAIKNSGGIYSVGEGLNENATVNQFDTTITKDSGLAFGTMFRTFATATTPSSASLFGHYNNFDYPAAYSTNHTGDLVASLDQVNWRGTGNSSTGRLIGSIGKIVSYTSSGTIENAIGNITEGTFDGGTVTNYYGTYSRNPNGGSTVNNVYGMYIENMTKGSLNNYALYAAGGKSYFGGQMGIGTTTPLATFDVRGLSGTTPAASISGQTSFAALSVNNSGNGDIFTASGSGGQNRFVIENDGDIGIGKRPTIDSSATGATILATGSAQFTSLSGSGLTDCDGSNHQLQWSAETKKFGCKSNADSTAVAKTSDQTVSASTTMQTDNQLTFAVGANETWTFKFDMMFRSPAAADLKFDITSPSGSTCTYGYDHVPTGVSGADQSCATENNTATADSDDDMLHFWGTIVNGSTAGNVTLRWGQLNASGTTTVYAGSSLDAFKVSGADLAEIYYSKDQTVQAGDVVMVDGSIKSGVQKTNKPYDARTLGIISTKPGAVLGDATKAEGKPVMLALKGRVPVKVASNSAAIVPGDLITSSGEAGKAMKATKAGAIIGKALEAWAPESGKATVMVFVENGWSNESITLSDEGTIDLDGSEPTIGNLKAESFEANMLNTKTLAAEEITINGKSLQAYILATLSQSILNPTNQISVASDNQSTTTLAMTSPNTIFDQITILSEQNENVARIDKQGNATFAGDLKAQDASLSGTLTAQDATISGTLRAEKIIAGEIEGLDFNQITNVTNIYNEATPSALLSEIATASPLPALSDSEVGLLKQLIYSPLSPFNASSAAELNIDSLDVDKATIANELNVLGKTTVNDLGVTGNITAGVLSIHGLDDQGQASINTLAGDLKLQSAGVGGIDMVAGKFTIDTKGNVNVQGNATFAKDVTVKGKLQAKNIDATGTGKFVDIAANALKIVRGAQADTSATETAAEGSAGSTVIKANKTERTIVSPHVTKDSLIYITATSNTQGVMPYVARQTAEDTKSGIKGSFTIEIPNNVKSDIKINWWIVN